MVFLCVAQVGLAHPLGLKDKWFLPHVSDKVSAKTLAAILEDVCDGEVEGGSCDTCPHEEEARGSTWSIRSIRFGHFLSRTSEDALVTIDGCQTLGRNWSGGMLITKRDGTWEQLDYMIALEADRCRKMRFASGRDLLVCEMQDSRREFQERSVVAVFAESESIKLRNLLVAGDSTCNCELDYPAQFARIDGIEFRDVNGDRIEDVVITAAFGKMKMTERRVAQCNAAWDDFIRQSSKAKKNPTPLPDPAVMKSYKIEFLFDGKRFQAGVGSVEAVRLFAWER